jgi:hypothetical protein
MDTNTLAETVAQIYAAIFLISGYPVPSTMPRVVTMPKHTLQQLICDKPCQVRAVYYPPLGVLLDETLNLQNSEYDRSILLHELVHHAQEKAGRFETHAGDCLRRAAAEDEAYQIQNRYLASKGKERIPIMRWRGLCGE